MLMCKQNMTLPCIVEISRIVSIIYVRNRPKNECVAGTAVKGVQ